MEMNGQLYATAILPQVQFNGNMFIMYFANSDLRLQACCSNLGPKHIFLGWDHTFMFSKSCLPKRYLQAHKFYIVMATLTQMAVML
jgi:hypothetical protein